MDIGVARLATGYASGLGLVEQCAPVVHFNSMAPVRLVHRRLRHCDLKEAKALLLELDLGSATRTCSIPAASPRGPRSTTSKARISWVVEAQEALPGVSAETAGWPFWSGPWTSQRGLG